MSIMVDWEIKAAIEAGTIGIDPFDPALINPTSLDIRLGKNYTFTKAKKPSKEGTWTMPQYATPSYFKPAYLYIDPQDKESFENRTRELSEYVLTEHETVIVSMFEHLTLPDNMSAKLCGKSSLGRLGLDNSSCAGWIDPGWRGVITMELTNNSRYNIKLTEGMKIGQLLFYKHEPVGQSYEQTGRYRDQKPGAGSLGV